MDLLREFNTDGTHDQLKAFKRLKEKSFGRKCYCFDLSSATDRIPSIFQGDIFQILSLDPNASVIVEMWTEVIKNRDFITPWGQTVRWEVGQPLGGLSSFPMFALWHHLMIQYAHYHSTYNKTWFSDYALLGDDVVIYDCGVAEEYKLLMKEIGVKINPLKTIISADESQLEFLKRISKQGIESSSLKYNIVSKDKEIFALDLIDAIHEREFDQPSAEVIPADHNYSQLLRFIEWSRFSLTLVFQLKSKNGNVTREISREDLGVLLKSERARLIEKKQSEVQELLMSNESLVDLFERTHIPYNAVTLGNHGYVNLHPMVYIINQTGEKLFMALSLLDTLDGVNEVEYMPVVSNKSYFLPVKAENIFLSRIYATIIKIVTTRDFRPLNNPGK